MITLGVLIILWMLYSIYKVFIKNGPYEEEDNLLIEIGAFLGLAGIIIGVIYLIITYLP